MVFWYMKSTKQHPVGGPRTSYFSAFSADPSLENRSQHSGGLPRLGLQVTREQRTLRPALIRLAEVALEIQKELGESLVFDVDS